MKITRRHFLEMSAAAAAAVSLGPVATACTQNGIPYRILGKTGLKVSLLGIGGYNIGINELLSVKESVHLMRTAIDEGINFFDNAWHYHDGDSEVRMGKALQDGYREKVILMTKHHGRDPATAQKHLEDNLRRLNTDYLDLWQFHEIMPGEPEKIYASGVLDFALKAKQEGKVRHIGFTGHFRPEVHLEMINGGFEWETIQMPINILDYHYISFIQNVLPVAVENNLGIIAMKTLAGTPGTIFKEGIARVEECLRFAMSMPTSTIISGIDSMKILMENINTVRNFTPMEQTEIDELVTSSAKYAEGGQFEGYKKIEADEEEEEFEEEEEA